jgi:UDP-glucose 4-epimerase
MNLLITGGCGYIGSVATRFFCDKGHSCVVFDNLERGHREALDPRARLIVGDLREASDIQLALRKNPVDAVVHFAAYALVGESMQDPLAYYRNNVQGGINLVSAMLESNVRRIVFSSTCATYGQPERMPISEDTPQNPTNPYGHSKLIFEQILSWHQRQKGFLPVFLRYFNVCGAAVFPVVKPSLLPILGEDHAVETHIIPNVLKVALGQKPYVEVFGDDYSTEDGTCVRDYIHVSDLIEAHYLALISGKTGAFNLGTGQGVSVKQIIDVSRQVTRKEIPVRNTFRRMGDPAILYAVAEKANRELDWRPTRSSVVQIVSDAWAWHQASPLGYGKSRVNYKGKL